MDFDRKEVEKLIGKGSGTIKALDDVSTSNVRHWYEMMDEPDEEWIGKMRNNPENPFAYTAELNERTLSEVARIRSRAVPVPMMMTWARQAYWSPEPKEPTEPHELVLQALEDAGYRLTIGIKLADELVNPVNIGDRLSYQVTLTGMSGQEEETKLGKGYVVDLAYTFSNQKGEVVSKHNYTVQKLKRLSLY